MSSRIKYLEDEAEKIERNLADKGYTVGEIQMICKIVDTFLTVNLALGMGK